jgi:hypothetical protein
MSERLTAEVKQLGNPMYEQLNQAGCAPMGLRDAAELVKCFPDPRRHIRASKWGNRYLALRQNRGSTIDHPHRTTTQPQSIPRPQ